MKAAALLLVLAVSGCSAMGVRPSSKVPLAPTCTEEYTLPAIDTVVAVASAAGAAYFALRENDQRMFPPPDDETLVISSLVLGGFYGGSAVLGYSRVSDCRRFKYPEEVVAPRRPQSPIRLTTPRASLP
jgi:hypothetical protein